MRWVLGIAGLLVLIVLVVCVIGYMLPQSHVASVSARYAAAPDSIWASLRMPPFLSEKAGIKVPSLPLVIQFRQNSAFVGSGKACRLGTIEARCSAS